MRVVVAIGLIAATALAGCASSAEIQQGAYEHLYKAETLEARGDYYHGAKERAAAEKQFAKARERAYDEAYRF